MQYRNIQNANTKTYTKEELKEDFYKIKNSILDQNPLSFVNKADLIKLYDDTEAQIRANMTEEEFFTLMNPLVVAVNCGHTNLSVSEALIKNRKDNAVFFPVTVIIQNGKIIADDNNALYGIQTGDEIKSINGNSSEYILSCFEKNISHDGNNLSGAMYIAENHFGYEYYEFIEKPQSFDIELVTTNGSNYQVSVDGKYIERENTAAWQLHLEEYSDVTYYNYEINGKESVLTVHVFFEGHEKFSDFLYRFFKEIKENNVERLTIDVRGNFGGHPQMAKELLSYLVSEETEYFSSDTKLPYLYKMQGLDKAILPKEDVFNGETTLLINGGCFSTCSHFVAVFKEKHLGKIVGEPTGGGSVCTDGSADVVLRNTGVRLHYSRTVYAVVTDSRMKNKVYPD